MDSVSPLTRQVAVITGAGRGIGAAIAKAYATAGAAVVCAARTRGELDQTVAAIQATGGRAMAVPTDITDLVAVDRLFATAAEAFGGVDLVVLNAGIYADRHRVQDSDPAAWTRTVEVNLFGAYYCARAAIPHLKNRGAGKMILVGSGRGHRGIPSGSSYAVSKAGLWMLTRVLAQELWPERISVNELIPGPVATTINAGESASVVESEWVKTPADVVPLALFLATQPVTGPTGQSFSLMRREN